MIMMMMMTMMTMPTTMIFRSVTRQRERKKDSIYCIYAYKPPGEDPPDEVDGVPLVDVAVGEVHLELLHHQPDVLLSELVCLHEYITCLYE